MATVSFSLCEKIIINPVLSMRVPPLSSEESTVWYLLQSEGLTRFIAIFTSIFAAADALTHGVSGAYKGAYLLASRVISLSPATWNKAEVYNHFRRAAWFGGLTLIGSPTGIIWPGAFRYFRYSPPAPLEHDPDTPEAVKEWVSLARSNNFPLDQFQHFWNKSSLATKHWFVHTFSRDEFASVRTRLAPLIYRPIPQHFGQRSVTWLSSQEIDQKVSLSSLDNIYNQAFFFHATSEENLELILKSRKVEVRHEKAFRGAFTSTRPQTEFGPCILGFRRNIERLSRLEHGFKADRFTYWAGFSQDIPVTETTLAYIISNEPSDPTLADRCFQWTGRHIRVISLDYVASKLDSLKNLDMGIPSEWPEENEETGSMILNTLKARVAVAVQSIPARQQMAVLH